MDAEFWIKKWVDGEIGFHQSEFHPQLKKFADHFAAGTILVPLCGKTRDMLYLASKGHEVIGVELSPIACQEFFEENGISYNKKSIANFMVYTSATITLWCGDFFHLPRDVWQNVNGIYDRAALVALPLELRKKYVSTIVDNGAKHTGILLVTFDYPQEVYAGPPFAVSHQEVQALYSTAEIHKLQSEEDKSFQHHPKLGPVRVTESVYWISL
jgi:thiopurine S-methyltransferase